MIYITNVSEIIRSGNYPMDSPFRDNAIQNIYDGRYVLFLLNPETRYGKAINGFEGFEGYKESLVEINGISDKARMRQIAKLEIESKRGLDELSLEFLERWGGVSRLLHGEPNNRDYAAILFPSQISGLQMVLESMKVKYRMYNRN